MLVQEQAHEPHDSAHRCGDLQRFLASELFGDRRVGTIVATVCGKDVRAILAGNAELARKLAALVKTYDAQFKGVFDAIRELMAPLPKPRRRIGFSP